MMKHFFSWNAISWFMHWTAVSSWPLYGTLRYTNYAFSENCVQFYPIKSLRRDQNLPSYIRGIRMGGAKSFTDEKMRGKKF